jgi:hypothetical protein
VSVASKEDDMFDYSSPVAKEESFEETKEDELEVDKI